MLKPKVKHYVEILFSEDFCCEAQVIELPTRRIKQPALISDEASGFYYFDVLEVVIDGTIFRSERKNISDITYIGDEFTLEQVMKKYPEEKQLIDNIKRSVTHRVVRTRQGDWVPLNTGDAVIKL